MTIILRSELDAMTAEQHEAWQYTPEQVKLMPGPWFRADDTPLGEGDGPLPTDYMWTGHPRITVDDDDLADAVRENRGLITAAIRLAEVDDGEGGKVVDRVALRQALRDTPQIKSDIEEKRNAREEDPGPPVDPGPPADAGARGGGGQ